MFKTPRMLRLPSVLRLPVIPRLSRLSGLQTYAEKLNNAKNEKKKQRMQLMYRTDKMNKWKDSKVVRVYIGFNV